MCDVMHRERRSRHSNRNRDAKDELVSPLSSLLLLPFLSRLPTHPPPTTPPIPLTPSTITSKTHNTTYLTFLVSNRRINTNPNTIADPDLLKIPLCQPPLKKIDLVWPSGLTVAARNMKGVTIKDALDAIYKQFKKKVGLHFLPCIITNRETKGLMWCFKTHRPMMSWTASPSSPASNGIEKNAIPALLCIRRRRGRRLARRRVRRIRRGRLMLRLHELAMLL